MALEPHDLLAGPRGRRLCFELALDASAEAHMAAFYAAHFLDPAQGTFRVLFGPGSDEPPRPTPAEVARALDGAEAAEPDGWALLSALTAAVDNARYWQEPDGEDVLAATPELRRALRRFADRIVASPHAAWWTVPLERAEQWAVTFPEVRRSEQANAAALLAKWRSDTVAEESSARRERPEDVGAMWTGTWWSTPPADLLRTTRRLGQRGPAGLWLVEDSMGAERATVTAIAVEDATVFEVGGPDAWAELCRRYPLEVTASRRHDWYRTTGETARWVLPDWSRVADDFDAVHLPAAGYLTTAGRAIEVGDGVAGVLAGWAPDETIWLTGQPRTEGRTQHWEKRDDVWAPVPRQD